jgi:serine/threonine-protein kinase RIO1
VPALVFRGAVEVPKRTRVEIQEAKRAAEELKEQKRQEKRNAWAEKEVAKQLKQLDRLVKRSA